ncbi:50S ribosomal protein L25/general stress protein Ctc [Pontibacillus sp. HMF3514]|uniref:50S ribosomal protein L25/general stress protein Ctc n=1 Tax=Pontibacillus sp. HMF3514 TaxID=2692425 RepID=UPI00131FD482|nr:50S ribosomal protein L25/general stress protein Ctc [Pontibacillus sp. HMF3514]QHE50629.1 50S ribosomal protein L25/general stress protein Ctc [Pontibacillus sp. HMF3514]
MAVTVKAKTRQDLRGSVNNKLRREGRIPAVVYGKDKEPLAVSVDSLELLKTLRDEGKNAIISLDVEGDSPRQVMFHEYQIEPIRNELYHADFYIVDMSTEVDVQVPIHVEGTAQGVQDGGILSQPLHELSLRAKPNQIPDEIQVDVSNLEVGDSFLVSDLKEANNYEITEDESTAIVTILPPQTEEVVEPGETQDGDAEPEVINQKDDDEEEEE